VLWRVATPGLQLSYLSVFLAARSLAALMAFLANETAVPEVSKAFAAGVRPRCAALIIECRTDIVAHDCAGASGPCAITVGTWAHGLGELFVERGGATEISGPEPMHASGSGRLGAARRTWISTSLEVLTDPIEFETVRAALQAAGFVPPARK